ncbi:MAG: alpha-L-fucosidase [Tepidisphaerales bacterium]
MAKILVMLGVIVALAANSVAQETREQRDARMAWWHQAKFGMFVHWGVYSVPAGYYKDQPVRGIGEWIMNRGKIPVAEYADFTKQFNPVKFDAERWVKIAKGAGMKYMVITSKHHDGFAMFASKASAYNIVNATPFKRDPLKELAEACRKEGIRLGFYYSQAQDWHHPGGAASGGHWDKAQDGSMDEYIDKIAIPQVKEILGNYGPDTPAVLWWDTPRDMTPERAAKLDALLALKPGIITNNRLGGGFKGDTETPEQRIPATGFGDRDWETCMTMNGTWGFKRDDNNWKTTETLIRNLVDIASKGGNYLLNVGPTAEGEIPQPSIERLAAVGAWMAANGKAIYGTTASPFNKLDWGRCTKVATADATTLYLHVFDWPKDGKLLVPGLKSPVASATMLVVGASIEAQPGKDGVTLAVPVTAPDAISSTIVLEIKGKLDIDQPPPAAPVAPAAQKPDPDGTITLSAATAALHGQRLRLDANKENLGYWTNADDWASWEVQVAKAGKYNVKIELAATGTASFDLAVGEQTLRVKFPATGAYTKYETRIVGTLELAAGKATLSIKPVKEGWKPVNIRNVKLMPVPAN